jgi:hypothetical protein
VWRPVRMGTSDVDSFGPVERANRLVCTTSDREAFAASSEVGRPPPAAAAADVLALRSALDGIADGHGTGAISASRMIDPLLDLWALATAVDHLAAVPVESLLTVLVRRSITTTDELAQMTGAVSRALDGVSVVGASTSRGSE